MNRYASVLIFLILVTSSVAGSIVNYNSTKQAVVGELNTALQRAIAANRSTWLAPDTIANYRRMQGAVNAPLCVNMHDESVSQYMSEALRGATFVELRLADCRGGKSGRRSPGRRTSSEQATNKQNQCPTSLLGGQETAAPTSCSDGQLCSDTILLTDAEQNASLAVRSVAQCSAATIFAMSDQRLPAVFLLLATVWAMFMLRRRRVALAVSPTRFPLLTPEQSEDEVVQEYSIGGIVRRDGTFFDNEKQEIHLTPMQRELLTMFFDAPDHKLLQTDITHRLWPKKDDASETLYALITRTKKAIEHRSDVRIEVDRGRGYSLTSRNDVAL